MILSSKNVDYDIISSEKDYWGKVVDVSDPTNTGKIRVQIDNIFGENISVDHIPWATPKYIFKEQHYLPHLNEIVQVKFLHNDLYYPQWFLEKGKDLGLTEDDYPSGVILLDRDLTEFGLDGSVKIRYTESEGIVFDLTKGDILSSVQMRPDNSVFLTNGKTEHVVHLSNNVISLGSEETSAQPAVLGDTNNEALDKLNDTIKALADLMNSSLTSLQSTAQSSPYTAALAPMFGKYATQVKSEIESLFNENKDFFPKTKSEIVKLD